MSRRAVVALAVAASAASFGALAATGGAPALASAAPAVPTTVDPVAPVDPGAPIDTTASGAEVPVDTAAAPSTAPATTLPGPPVTVSATLPDTVPMPVLPPIDDPDAVSARLIPVPAGCDAPAPEQAVFIGTVAARDAATVRYVVGRVRSGTLAGFTVAGQVDVHYGPDAQYLHVGRTYLVGAGLDAESGLLSSTVRPPAPEFGGSEIAGLETADVDCPAIDDPVRTLQLDGTGVESGVLAPLSGAGGRILRAVLQPIGVAFAVLVGLVGLKLLVFAFFRSLRGVGGSPDDPLTL